MPTVKINAQKNVANPGWCRWSKHRYLLSFGAYGDTHVLVYADSLDSAVEEVAQWLLEHAPGVFANDAVLEDYHCQILAGLSAEQAWETATVDMTLFGDNNWIPSWEWGAVEDPTRDDISL